jgi:hypothetical protein
VRKHSTNTIRHDTTRHTPHGSFVYDFTTTTHTYDCYDAYVFFVKGVCFCICIKAMNDVMMGTGRLCFQISMECHDG